MKTATSTRFLTGPILLPAGTGYQPQPPSPARPVAEIYRIPGCGTAVARRPRAKRPAAGKFGSLFAQGKTRDIAHDPFLERLARLH